MHIPKGYQLQEMDSPDYLKRPEANVVDSDATVMSDERRGFTSAPLAGVDVIAAHLTAEDYREIDMRNSCGFYEQMRMKNGSMLAPHMPSGRPPKGAVAADRAKLNHVNTYGDLPEFYVDYPFDCVDCGKHEVWTAAQQKWYYEEAKGHTWAVAVRCRPCRKRRKENRQKSNMEPKTGC